MESIGNNSKDNCNKKKYLLIAIAGVFFLFVGCTAGKNNRAERKYKTNVIAYPAKEPVLTEKKEYHSLQIEFGKKMLVPPDSITNLKLYSFLKQWLGTPYLRGGKSESGIDCSGFVQRLYRTVYNIDIPGTSVQQFYAKWVDVYSNTNYLVEGDLVFFNTLNNGNPVSHVGLYLHNGYFINAASKKGVSFGKLSDNYWSSRYVAAGRLKPDYYKIR